MLKNFLNLALYFVIFAAFAIGIYLFIKKAKNETKSEIKLFLKRNGILKPGALVFALLITLAYAVGVYFSSEGYASATVTLNYAEASLGQNANGTRYNMSEIICDDVLARTIEKGGFENITVSDLKKCFSVAPLIEGNSYYESGYHISTEYMVNYTASKKTSQYPSATIVELLCNSYREYYLNKYRSDFSLSNNYSEEISQLDYFDKAGYLDKEANKVLNYLYGLQNKNSAFVSSTGATFAAIAAKVYNLKFTQINTKLMSFVLQNGLSENASIYVERLKYLNKQASFERDEMIQSYTLTNLAVKRYAEEMATIVLVPTWDEDGEYYMGRTKVGIDTLSVQAKGFSENLAQIEKSIETNRVKIEQFSVDALNTESSQAEADDFVEVIYQGILKFSEEAREIGQEYYANQMNQCISATVYSSSMLSEMKFIAATFVLAYVAFWMLYTGRKYAHGLGMGE